MSENEPVSIILMIGLNNPENLVSVNFYVMTLFRIYFFYNIFLRCEIDTNIVCISDHTKTI